MQESTAESPHGAAEAPTVLGPLAASLVVTALFAWTRPRSLPDFDAAEFLLLARKGGIAHPPGYPVYTLALRFWSSWVGDDVASFTLLSALFCGAAAGLLCHALRQFSSSATALFATLTVVTAEPLWRTGTNLEPFALHLLLTSLVVTSIGFLLRPNEHTRQRGAWLAGLSLGLGLCHHHTLAFAVPSVFVAMVLPARGVTARMLLFLCGCLIGALPLLRFLWAHEEPGFVWGDWKAPLLTTWSHLLREEYGTFSLARGTQGSPLTGLSLFALRWCGGLSVVFVLPCVLGVREFLAARSHRRAFLVFASLWLFAGPGFACLLRIDEAPDAMAIAERFFAMPLLLTAPFLALGLDAWKNRVARWRMGAWLWILLLAHIGLQLQSADRRGETLFATHTAAVQRQLPADALLIGSSDVDNSVGLALRADAETVPFHHLMVGLLELPWYRAAAARRIDADMPVHENALEDFVRRTAQRRPVLVSASAAHHDGVPWSGGQALGPLVRFGGPGRSAQERLSITLQDLDRLQVTDLSEVTPWEDGVLEEWRAGLHWLAMELQQEGDVEAAARARAALAALLPAVEQRR
ncbi:MAG: protein O-mannosyl-transferase family [Myxococcota bacterium]